MTNLSKQDVVEDWFFRGLEHFYLAFQLDSPFLFTPFHNSLGLEMIFKAYLLAIHSKEYESLGKSDAISQINTIAKEYGHKLVKMIDEIKEQIPSSELNVLLDTCYDAQFNGHELLEALQSAYFECRYPVPEPIHRKYPMKGKEDLWYDPIVSSHSKLCYSLACEIIKNLVPISKERFKRIVKGEDRERFCNLFFETASMDILS
ncbi:hypothetical protein ACFL96_00515 [Thermoproteota archaeon]